MNVNFYLVLFIFRAITPQINYLHCIKITLAIQHENMNNEIICVDMCWLTKAVFYTMLRQKVCNYFNQRNIF